MSAALSASTEDVSVLHDEIFQPVYLGLTTSEHKLLKKSLGVVLHAMKSLVVDAESAEGVDFLIINLIDGDYDTTGLNADRVENILAFYKWCVRRGLREVYTRMRCIVRTYSQGSNYVAWKLTTLVATSRAVSKTVVGCTLTIW